MRRGLTRTLMTALLLVSVSVLLCAGFHGVTHRCCQPETCPLCLLKGEFKLVLALRALALFACVLAGIALTSAASEAHQPIFYPLLMQFTRLDS